jgi:hypothetical protein
MDIGFLHLGRLDLLICTQGKSYQRWSSVDGKKQSSWTVRWNERLAEQTFHPMKSGIQ